MSLVEVGRLIGISKATIFAYRSGKMEVSPKAWKALAEAESRNGLSKTYPETSDASPRVEEPKGQTAAFRDYLEVLRGIRAEAEAIAGGDAKKTEEWFDRLLATWRDTVAAKRRNSATPWGTSDAADLAKANELVKKFAPLPVPVEPPVAQKHA